MAAEKGLRNKEEPTHFDELKRKAKMIKNMILGKRLFSTIALFTVFPAFATAQEYQTKILNKGALYATSSLLQDYDNDGDLDIIVTRRAEGNLPAAVEWLENDGTGQFPRHELFRDLVRPVDIDLGDFDNDGRTDYLVSDRGNLSQAGQLVWFQRQANDTYIKWTIEPGVDIAQADVADFDKDGNLDVVAVGFDLTTVSIYMNDGFFNFTEKVVAQGVSQVDLVTADDLDGDQDEDIIIGNGGSDSAILFNNGSAVFDSAQKIYTWSDFHASTAGALAVADLNQDGRKDILTFSGVGTGGLYFLDGAKNFDQSLIQRVGIDIGGGLAIADMDNNGWPDILRQHYSDDFISILYQDSVMTFRNEILERSWDNTGGSQMAVGDLDGDNDLDLVFPENGNIDGDISWFENIAGKLHRHYLYSEIQSGRIAKFGDLDGDGDLDVVACSADEFNRDDEIFWYENRGETGFSEWRIDDDLKFPADLELADLDGDGALEVIATARDDNDLLWYKKEGPAWKKFQVEDNANQPYGCAVADIDRDNDKDLALCSSADNKVYWYLNNGAGSFTRRVVDPNLAGPHEIEAADLDADGDLDLAVIATDTANTVTIYLNDGQQRFTRQIIFRGKEALDLEIGDWDGNNTPDLVVCFSKQSAIAPRRDVMVLQNSGAAVFTPLFLISQNETTTAIKLVDADGDNDLDLVFNDGLPKLAENRPGQALLITALRPVRTSSYRVWGIDAGDLNRDGVVDLLFTDGNGSEVFLLLGEKSSSVSEAAEFMPEELLLSQNYPNPFNPSTTITFTLPQRGRVRLEIFNLLGEKVATVLDEVRAPGTHSVHWQPQNLPSGTYLYRLETKGYSQTRKLLLLR
jgi:hypothetical protein